jgi:hypothetical protein
VTLLHLLLACTDEAPTWQVGQDLSTLRVVLVDDDEGVHPSSSVLDDPGNPFDARVLGAKWEILASDCAPGFYAFATALALQPTGEHQYYAAWCMQQLVDSARLRPEDDHAGWSIAVRGYQQVLDAFPGSVTYDATGTYAWPLAPLAYAGIVAMGGTPEGWVAVEDTEGTVVIVREGVR